MPAPIITIDGVRSDEGSALVQSCYEEILNRMVDIASVVQSAHPYMKGVSLPVEKWAQMITTDFVNAAAAAVGFEGEVVGVKKEAT